MTIKRRICGSAPGRPMSRTYPTAIVAMAAALLGGCATRLHEIGREPSLSPVGSGLQAATQVREERLVGPGSATELYGRPTPGSLWTDRASDLFKDARARRPGDIVSVAISVRDKASFDNSSKRSRDASHGFGLDISKKIDWAGAASAGKATVDSAIKANTQHDGKGAIARSESIELRIAAVVTEVLSNGNLVIQGSQELRVNQELRELTISGIVSVADIRPDNTISYERIAEARVSYGGRGRVMEVQQPGWGHQIIDLISPF